MLTQCSPLWPTVCSALGPTGGIVATERDAIRPLECSALGLTQCAPLWLTECSALGPTRYIVDTECAAIRHIECSALGPAGSIQER